MPLTNYAEDTLAGWLFVNTAWTVPTTFYVGLHTASPGEIGTPLNEVTGLNYTRMGLARGNVDFAAVVAGSGLAATATTLIWPVAGDAWGTITHLSLCDSAAGGSGNVLFYEAAVTSRTIGIGDVYRIGAGNLAAGFE